MATGFGVVGVATAGVAINSAYQISKKRDPFPALVAGSVFVCACVAIAAINPEIGHAVAVLYLLSTLLTRGDYLVSTVTNLG